MASLPVVNVLQTVRGVYHNGHIDLLDKPVRLKESAVLVTFVPGGGKVDLKRKGFSRVTAADLRGRLKSFAHDWDRPEMDAYDTL